MIRAQLSSKAASQVPDALVRAAILHTLGEVTLTFDGLCRTLDCNSTAARTMVLMSLNDLCTDGRVEMLFAPLTDARYRVPK